MTRAVLEVRNLWVGDGPGASVQDVSFCVGRGQVVGVLGGPEAGKSRLLRCIGLDFPPTSGQILLAGDDVTGAGAAERRQLRSSVIELVHPPAPPDTPDTTVPARTAPTRLGAAPGITIPVAGMRQRIQIAKALTSRSRVLLLDEPFACVDDVVRVRILELLARLRATVGTAVIIATRDAATLAPLADEIVELSEGRVVRFRPALVGEPGLRSA